MPLGRGFLWCAVCAAAIGGFPLLADAQTPVDDALKGFDEPPAAIAPADDALKGFDDAEPTGAQGRDADTPPRGVLPSWLRLGGGLGLGLDANIAHDAPTPGTTDHRGLSRLRGRVDLEADLVFGGGWKGRAEGYAFYDLAYAVNGRGDYTRELLDANEREVDTGSVYLQGPLADDIDLKVGRQIVVWGKSDNIRVTDVLNPIDNRVPGRTDIEDLRLPVAMTRLDGYRGDWNLSLIAVHEPRFDRVPAFGSDFFSGAAPPPPEDAPRASLRNQEGAAALNGVFSGWDLSLYGAYIFDDRAHVVVTGAGPVRRHARLWMGGLAANAAFGNWLVKGEAAVFDGLRFRDAPGERFARLDVLAGVEYAGFADTTVSFEIANRHVLGFDPRATGGPEDGRENDPQTALRVTRKFLHDTLEITLLALTFGMVGQNGALQRVQASYDLTDSIEVTGGAVNYVAGKKRGFTGAGGNDRLFVEIAWKF